MLQVIERELSELNKYRVQRLLELQNGVLKLQILLQPQQMQKSQTVIQPTHKQGRSKNPAAASSLDGRTQTNVQSKSRDSESTAGQPEKTTPRKPIPATVTTQPVDRLGLANNLFGTGDYELAFETYGKIKPAELQPRDKVWVEYQIACCHRKLGNIAEAEKQYRIVAAQPQANFLSQSARWWLDALKNRKQLKAGLQQLHQTLESIEKQLNEPSNK